MIPCHLNYIWFSSQLAHAWPATTICFKGTKLISTYYTRETYCMAHNRYHNQKIVFLPSPRFALIKLLKTHTIPISTKSSVFAGVSHWLTRCSAELCSALTQNDNERYYISNNLASSKLCQECISQGCCRQATEGSLYKINWKWRFGEEY